MSEESVLSQDKVAIIDMCKCFPYQAKETTSPIIVWAIASGLLVGGVIYMIINASQIDINKMFLFVFPLMIVIFGYIIKVMQFDAMKALTQYFKDETGMYYKIQFTKVSMKVIRIRRHFSIIPLVGEIKTLIEAYKGLCLKEEYMEEAYAESQNKLMGYYYVTRYNSGIRDWDFMNGGEAKVIPLGYLESKTKNRYRFNYEGKIKTVKIPAYYGVE